MIRGFETRSWHNSLSGTLTCPCIREKGCPRSDIGLIPRYSALLFLSRNQACLQGVPFAWIENGWRIGGELIGLRCRKISLMVKRIKESGS